MQDCMGVSHHAEASYIAAWTFRTSRKPLTTLHEHFAHRGFFHATLHGRFARGGKRNSEETEQNIRRKQNRAENKRPAFCMFLEIRLQLESVAMFRFHF